MMLMVADSEFNTDSETKTYFEMIILLIYIVFPLLILISRCSQLPIVSRIQH